MNSKTTKEYVVVDLETTGLDIATDEIIEIAAVRVKDTVKRADDDGLVRDTPDRRELWNVQTPQIFRRDRYEQAMAHAVEQGLDLTDDGGLMEAAGYSICMENGSDTLKKLADEICPCVEQDGLYHAFMRLGLM